MPFRFVLNYFKQFSLDITIVLCLFAAKQIVDHSAFLVSPEAAIKKNVRTRLWHGGSLSGLAGEALAGCEKCNPNGRYRHQEK
jgi:hypothetical protein